MSLNKIAILGAGWLGWPLAKKLVEDGYSVNASTTSANKLDALATDGINPFLIQLLPSGPEGESLEAFLNVDLLILNIPPGRRKDKIANFSGSKSGCCSLYFCQFYKRIQ